MSKPCNVRFLCLQKYFTYALIVVTRTCKKNEHGVSNNVGDAEENLVGKNSILSLVSKYLQCKVVEEPRGSGKLTNAEKQKAIAPTDPRWSIDREALEAIPQSIHHRLNQTSST